MPKYTLKGLLTEKITFASVKKTFEFLSTMPLSGFGGMWGAHYTPIRTKVAEVTRKGMPNDINQANRRYEEVSGHKPTKGLGNK